tara:strand:- start:1321 stop:2079 length:759 start_codon:yes stop_codon:yes gene_type:complete
MKNLSKSILILSIVSSGYAAPIPSSETTLDSSLSSFLQKPLEQRVDVLKNDKIQLDLVEKMAFDSKYHLKQRWTAFRTLASLENNHAKKLIKKAVKSNEWFLRDAAIKNAAQYYPKAALRISRSLITDPSLIVRTTAVKVIHRLKDYQSEDLLWRELDSKKNFRKGKSLWIRKHIAKALYDFGVHNKTNNKELSEERIKKLLSLMEDDEKQVQFYALKSLNSFVSSSVSDEKAPIETQVRRWQAWANQSGIY